MYVAKAHGKNQVQLYGKSRRSFRRVETALDGEFRLLAPGSYPMTTVNISEAGLLFARDGITSASNQGLRRSQRLLRGLG